MTRRQKVFIVVTVPILVLAGALWLRTSEELGTKRDSSLPVSQSREGSTQHYRKKPSAPFPAKQPREPRLLDQPVAARMSFIEGLSNKRSNELLESLITEAEGRSDTLKIDSIKGVLAVQLRSDDEDAVTVIQRMKGLVLDEHNDAALSQDIIESLGGAADKKSMVALLDLLNDRRAQGLRSTVLAQITTASQKTWGGRYHEELSEPLEEAWRRASPESDSIFALANAIAAVGAPSGLDLLLSEISRQVRTMPEFEKSADSKARAAFLSLDAVRNPGIVPYLASKLTVSAPESVVTAAVGDALSHMGYGKATEVLLLWVAGNSADVRSYIPDWFDKLRDVDSVEAVEKIQKEAHFKNRSNRSDLEEVFANWKAQHAN